MVDCSWQRVKSLAKKPLLGRRLDRGKDSQNSRGAKVEARLEEV